MDPAGAGKMQRDLEGLRLNSTDVYTFCLWGPSQFCDLAKWRIHRQVMKNLRFPSEKMKN